MTLRRFSPIAFVLCTMTANAGLLLNEVDSDQAGTDTQEFVEIYDEGDGNTPLDGYVLVIYNGNGSSVINAYDLDGLSTDANGFFVAGQPAVPNIDPRIVAGTGIDLVGGNLQNGEEAVALYQGLNASDFPNGATASTTGLVDAVVFRSGNDSGSNLISDLGLAGAASVNEADGTEMDARTASVGRSSDGGALKDQDAWSALDNPSPGVKNSPEEEISASLSIATISENGGTSILTVSLDSAADGDVSLDIEVASFDNSELIIPTATVPDGQLSVDVTLTGLDDGWRDFDQTLTLNISDPLNRFFPSSIEITVTDDENGSPVGAGLRVNEIYPAVSNDGDPNGDGRGGASDGSDEFVELVNDSDAALDVSGFTLSDFATVRHTFPAGTILDPGCAIVVFGSGAPEGRPEGFAGAIVQNANGANEFGLSLNNDADLVSIKNTGDVEIAGATWVDAAPVNGSLTLDPDLNATNTYTVHSNFGTPFSPGRTTTGDPFCDAPTLSVSASPASVSEDAGMGGATLSLTRSGSLDDALTVDLRSDDTTEATVQATAMFGVGQDEIDDIPLDIVNDSAADGIQTVTFTASADGYVDGSGSLDVVDDGDESAMITINEVDYNPDGSDDEGLEFVELFDGGSGNTPLDGFVLVFYNGNENGGPDAEYRIVDLAGAQTNASGFFVVSTPSNGIQNGGSGGDGLALYSGAAADDFDGTTPLFPPLSANLVDALVYEVGDGVLAGGLSYVGPDLDDSGSGDVGISRLPDGTGEFQLAPLTRGSSNSGGGGNAYDSWAAGFPGIGDREDDDDFDGLSSILEFAFGFDPTVPNSLPDPTYDPGTGNLRLTVPKGPEAGGDANTTYFASTSTDGINWSDTDLTIVIDDGNNFAAEYTGSAPTALLRIGVNVTP